MKKRHQHLFMKWIGVLMLAVWVFSLSASPVYAGPAGWGGAVPPHGTSPAESVPLRLNANVLSVAADPQLAGSENTGTGDSAGDESTNPSAVSEEPSAVSEDPGGVSEDPSSVSEDPGGVSEDPDRSTPDVSASDDTAAENEPVAVRPLIAGDLVANLTWLNAPPGQSANMTWSSNEDRTTQTPTYSLNLQTSNTSYDTGQLTVRIPLSLWNDRNGNPVNPSAIGVPQAPNPGNSSIPFNYRIDTATNELVFTNTSRTEAASNYSIQVQYNVVPWNTRDMSTRSLTASARGVDPQGNVNTAATMPITYTVNTGVRLDQIVKEDPHPLRYWEPYYTNGQPQPADFANYRWVSWRLIMGGRSNQPYRVNLVDTSTPGGQVYLVSGDGNYIWNTQNPNNYTVGANGNITSIDFTDPNVGGPAGGSGGYLRVLMRYPLTGGNTMLNSVRETLTPLDGIDPPLDTVGTAAEYTWTDYTFSYSAAESLFTKFSADWDGQDQNLTSKLALLRNGVDLNVEWGIQDRVQLYSGVNYTDGPSYSGELVDDFANWRMVNSDNTTGSAWQRMTADDYQYTGVRLNATSYTVERTSGRQIYYPQGQNGPLVTVQAYVNGAWTTVGTRYAGELAYSDGRGGVTAAGAYFALPAGTTQVRAQYENAADYTQVRMDFNATIKASSPTLRAWLQDSANNGRRLRLQNFAYHTIRNQNGSLRTTPPAAYNFSDAQGVNADLQSRDIADYGALVNRATASVTVWDMRGTSSSGKLIANPVNDAANQRVNVDNWLYGNESYTGMTDAEYAQLMAAGWKPPFRDEAVFYDLLPLGMYYNSTMPQGVYDVNGNATAADMSISTKDDYKDTGRQLVVINVTYKNPGTNYTPSSDLVTPARQGDGTVAMGTIGYQPRGVTGYSVRFGASVPWDNVPYARTGTNIAAYQVPESRPLAGDGNQDNGDVAPMNTVMGNDGRPVFYDLRGNGVDGTLDTRYMSDNIAINVPVAAASGLTKQVRADANGPLGSFNNTASTRTGSTYTYQLRVAAAVNSQMSNVVLFDILESAANTDGRSGEVFWKGTYEDITLDYARQMGINPVVYYSTEQGLTYENSGLSANDLTTNTARWSTTQPADKSTITAIAVDLRTRPNGQPYTFGGLSGTQVLIHMSAPSALPPQRFAYNQAAYYSTLTSASGDSVTSLREGERTSIDLDSDPAFEKSAYPPGGSDAVSAGMVAPDGLINYTIEYNPGIHNTTGIVVSDALPQNVTLQPGSITFKKSGTTTPVSMPDTCYDAASRTITWPAYDQAEPGTSIFTFQVRADALPSGANGVDYRLYENQATVHRTNVPPQTSNRITHQQRNRWATITKAAVVVDGITPNAPDAATGGIPRNEENGTPEAPVRTPLNAVVEYRLRVTNTGANRLSGQIDVSDAVPAGVRYIAGSAKAVFSGGAGASQAISSVDDSGETITWTLNRMSDGEQALLTFRVGMPAALLSPGDTRMQAEMTFGNTAQMTDRGKNQPPVSTTTTHHRLEEAKVVVIKQWVDDGSAEVKYPAEVLMQLMANNTASGAPASLKEAGGWTHTWTGLPIRNERNEPIQYSTVEVGHPGEFQVSYSADTFTVTNRYSPGYTSRTVVKSWDDADNVDQLRPASIQVRLYANGEAVGDAVTLNDANKWRHTWSNIPLTRNDVPIAYTVRETSAVEEYETSHDDTLFIITNKHIPRPPDPPDPPDPPNPPNPPAPPPPQPPAPPPPQPPAPPPQPPVLSPPTGDDSMLTMWIVLLATAAIGGTVSFALYRRWKGKRRM